MTQHHPNLSNQDNLNICKFYTYNLYFDFVTVVVGAAGGMKILGSDYNLFNYPLDILCGGQQRLREAAKAYFREAAKNIFFKKSKNLKIFKNLNFFQN